jgi:uncharacterized UPF0160 family protein
MFSLFKKKKIIITHSGTFHADDMFACATLGLLLDKRGFNYKIIRTRDEEVIETGDYVVDVGGEYDPKRNRFDHHQIGGAGVRENTIPYASFGLVWKEFGEQLTGSVSTTKRIDENLVASIDATDNGISITKSLFSDINTYGLHGIISAFLPSWKEVETANVDIIFLEFVSYAKTLLNREIVKAQDLIEGEQKVSEIYTNTEDKRLIVMDSYLPWKKELSRHPEPLFLVSKGNDGNWNLSCVRDDLSAFTNRKNLPASWAGLRDEKLAQVTGVSDAVFCHTKRFLCVAKSKEGALKLGKMALEM